jgi:hypothetical protein
MIGNASWERRNIQGWSPDRVRLREGVHGATAGLAAGCYDDVMITDERSPLEPESGPAEVLRTGSGNVQVGAVDDPEDRHWF